MEIPSKLLKKYKLKDPGSALPGLFPDLFRVLTMVKDGWRWQLDAYGRIAAGLSEDEITDAGPIILTSSSYPLKLPDAKQPGWILLVGAMFDNPYGELTLRLDKWRFSMTPALMRASAPLKQYLDPYNFRIGVNAWAHATPYGPLYGVEINAPQPMPLSEDLSLSVSNGSNGAKTTIELLIGIVGRIIINDFDAFMEGVQRHKLEQYFGRGINRKEAEH